MLRGHHGLHAYITKGKTIHPVALLRRQAQHSLAYDLQRQQPELLLHVNGLRRAFGNLQLHAESVSSTLCHAYLKHMPAS